MPLDLSSEPFAASGGLAGEGARKLLGAPTLTQLQTLLREAGQNSWDARCGDSIRISIRIRTLTPEQAAHLRSQVITDLPEPEEGEDVLAPLREADPSGLKVLEIADFGTNGLCGPVRADRIETGDVPLNFVNLVRNIGARRDTKLGGGTYGYGKMALFAASRCSTVVLDSLAVTADGVERRLIGCHVGDEYADADLRRFTGRHWWGIDPDGGTSPAAYVDPATGVAAEALSAGLGLPARSDADTGTTVMVILPDLEDEATADIRDALLWFFWPKMLARGDQPAPIAFDVWNDGEQVQLPPPAQFPPLDLYVEAWEAIRRNDPDVKDILVGPGRRRTGRLAIRRGFRGDRSLARPDGLIPRTSFAVALMRPVELVVKYLEGQAIGNDVQEWAGVFIVDRAEDIERAFANSEPPAHDDWNPSSLPDRAQRTLVNVTLNRIGQLANETVFPRQPVITTDTNQPPLARAAARLGELVPLDPERVAVPDRTQTSGVRRSWRVEQPEFLTLEQSGDAVVAVFLVVVSNTSTEPLRLTASPGLVIDDRLTVERVAPGGGEVRVLDWQDGDGAVLSTGTELIVAPRDQVSARVRVAVPELVAVGLSISAVD